MLRLLAILLALLPLTALAQSTARLDHSRVELIAETPAPAPGKPLTLGIVIAPDAGWHAYWQNPGDSGVETRAVWTLPPGAAAGPLRYPPPERFATSGLTSFVYSHPVTLPVDIALPTLPPGTPVPIRLKLDWLVCDPSLCVPQSATLTLNLRTGTGTPGSDAARIAAARAALPKPLPGATYAVQHGRIDLSLPIQWTATAAEFFPLTEFVTDYGAPQKATYADRKARLELKPGTAKPSGHLAGVVVATLDGKRQAFAIDPVPGSVAAEGAPLGKPERPERALFALAFLGAVLGGLILNIMPCVFPILSLKALSLARAGGSEANARREALAYTGGVILTCLALGGLILALRAAGSSIGWAFQLQDPRVVAFLLLLMTAIALNFAGLFELEIGGRGVGSALASKHGASGAFWTGVLAAFVATPCTGPFMGAALGAAIALPPALGLAVFGGLGLGLALPFLALAYIPALRRVLPRPGAWMDAFRRILAVPIFLTALGLAWVLGRQTGVDGLTLGLGGALLLGLALWWLGRAQVAGRSAILPLLAALATLLVLVPVRPAPAGAAEAAAVLPNEEKFTQARLDALRAAGTPVFLYFTADWCLTCKVNERGALADAGVAAAFSKAGIVTLVGDWTRPDPAISAYLASQDRSGIPLYQFYAKAGRVETLPQLLTPARLAALATS